MKIRDIVNIINKNKELQGLIDNCKDEDLAEYMGQYEEWLNTDLNIKTVINNNYNTYSSKDIMYGESYTHKPSFDINKPMY